MRYTFRIRDNTTGEERIYAEDFDWDDEGLMLFQWGENNYACDCNRGLFFARAAGEEPDLDLDDCPCGNERFAVLSALGEDGVTVPVDDPVDPKVEGKEQAP